MNMKIKAYATRAFVSLMCLIALFCCQVQGLCGEESESIEQPQHEKSLVFLPVVFYTPETRVAGGVGGMYSFRLSENGRPARPSVLKTLFIYTQNQQMSAELTPELYFKDDQYFCQGTLIFKRFPNLFFGIGPDTGEGQKENYTSQTVWSYIWLQKKMAPQLYAGLLFDFEHMRLVKIENNGLLEDGNIPGSKGGICSGLGASLSWDSRDRIFFPRSGIFFQASAKIFHHILGSDFNFRTIMIDYRRYISLFSSHVLAFQGYLKVISGNPPFHRLSLLGGEYLMRGYYLGRFRDRNMLAFQAEYRLPLWWRFGFVGFVGFGNVTDRISRLSRDEWKYAIGIGLRFKVIPEEDINIRVDVGFGRESSGVYFTVLEAF